MAQAPKFVKLSSNVVYRPVQNELVVVELDSGAFYHFTPDTLPFLELFKEPRSLEQWAKVNTDMSKTVAFAAFTKTLIDNQILVETTETPVPFPATLTQTTPTFVRKGNMSLEEVNFFC